MVVNDTLEEVFLFLDHPCRGDLPIGGDAGGYHLVEKASREGTSLSSEADMGVG